jgi:hypothetical protein
MLASYPIADKRQLGKVCFCGQGEEKTENEFIYDLVCEEFENN